ncbi:MAG: HD domain-containing protein [Acidimicrobiia bacterium]|nr:HD domain-containing protein [Acidimicrobiia bacterium]
MDQHLVVELAAAVDGELARRIEFLLEVDKLKTVLRRSRLVDGSRFENTAEHSWHLALAALVLAPYAGDDVDIVRAVEILLVHDLVEIDAGDTYIYDSAARDDKQQREQQAATRIFGLLPETQESWIAERWHEYEDRVTATARFAYAIDRLQPLLLNAASGGRSWQENGISYGQAAAVNGAIDDGSSLLWAYARRVLGEAAERELLADDRSNQS